MNDADRKAFDKWCKVPGGHLFYHMQADAWQAACEWRDSQVGEPVALLCKNENFGDVGEQEFLVLAKDTHPCIAGLACAFPVYTTPPAAQINQQLTALLEKSLHWLDGLCDAGPLGQQYPSDELTKFVEDIRAVLAATQMKGDA